ncbi:cysteine-rich CWC family protein [Cohnella soli]|uniref:Cysteine-rich CWC family protein n=1 Tax=Cohnella soli TaxID=425005 RepID=A0ABW0I3F5_9BACL
MDERNVDPSACPLCGRPNECGSVAGNEAGTCWCFSAVFPPELLDKVPLESRRKACICKSCAESRT